MLHCKKRSYLLKIEVITIVIIGIESLGKALAGKGFVGKDATTTTRLGWISGLVTATTLAIDKMNAIAAGRSSFAFLAIWCVCISHPMDGSLKFLKSHSYRTLYCHCCLS